MAQTTMVVIDGDLHDKIKEYAHKHRISIKAVVATVLNEFLAAEGMMPADLKAEIDKHIQALGGTTRRDHSAFNPWGSTTG